MARATDGGIHPAGATPLGSRTSADLVRALCTGPIGSTREALEGEIFGRICECVMPVLLRRLRLPMPDAEEIAADVANQLLMHPQQYQASLGTVETYVRHLAYRRGQDLLRAWSTGARWVPLDSCHAASTLAVAPLDEVGRGVDAASNPDLEAAGNALDALPEQKQRVTYLRLNGYTHSAIAELLGVNEAAVRTCWHRARKELGEALMRSR